MILCLFRHPNRFCTKKTNGTVYIEHPAIDAVEAFATAFVTGDKAKMAAFLTDGFKAYNGTSSKDKPGFIADPIKWNPKSR